MILSLSIKLSLVFKIFNDDPLRFLLKVFFGMLLSYIFGISFHISAPTRENAFFCILSLDYFLRGSIVKLVSV